jgi:hypothetical protein
MYNLKLMLKNELEGDKSLATKLAQVAGLANPTPIYKFVGNKNEPIPPDKEMDSFNGLLNIVRFLFPNNELEIMTDYILMLDPCNKSSRCALEYASFNRLHNLFEHLINRMLDCNNAESREWATLYNLMRQFNTGKISPLDLVNQIQKEKVKRYDTIVFAKIVQLYAYYDIRLTNIMLQLSIGLDSQIQEIKDDYIKDCYLMRLSLLMLNICLHENKTEDISLYGNLILEKSEKLNMNGMAHHKLGDSLLFEGYDKAYSHLEKAYDIFRNLGNRHEQLKQVKRSICFLQNYWLKKPEFLEDQSNEVSDIHEMIFYLIRSGQLNKAKELVNEIDLKKLSDYRKGFHYFYRGLISKNKDDFYVSVAHFKLSGDKFYRQLSLKELENLGENKTALFALSI